MVIMNDNVQQQFIYLIVAICRNTLRSILSQFLEGNAVGDFAQLFLPKIQTKYQSIRYLPWSL